MSFVEMDDVMNTIEGLAKNVFTAITGEVADYKFPRCLMLKLWQDLVLTNQM